MPYKIVIIFVMLLTVAASAFALTEGELQGRDLPFIARTGAQAMDNALAMNIPYGPIKALRPSISSTIGRPLKFLTAWEPEGEAHITVVTPPEYARALAPILSMDEINDIAELHEIQHSKIELLGLGSGRAILDGKMEETFFVVVESMDLRRIRLAIYREFLKKGGKAQSWNPNHWFPHITIGYTKRDLHEQDGVIKNESSLDPRFQHLLRGNQ